MGSRKDIGRKQRICISEVNRLLKTKHRMDPKVQEVIRTFESWNRESKVFKDIERTKKYVGTDEFKPKGGRR